MFARYEPSALGEELTIAVEVDGRYARCLSPVSSCSDVRELRSKKQNITYLSFPHEAGESPRNN